MQRPDEPEPRSDARRPTAMTGDARPDQWVDLVYEPPPRRTDPTPDSAIPEIALRRTNPHSAAAVAAREAHTAARLTAEARARAAQRATRGRRLLPFVALGAALAWTLREPAPTLDPMPEALVGSWATAHPDYRGRTLVIGPSSVQIGQISGAAPLDGGPWPIEALSVRTVGDESAVSLAYRTSSGRVFLNAVLANTAPPSLRLAQPDGVAWQRAPVAPQPDGGTTGTATHR